MKNIKVQIRQGVFETNSSSTHAISICSLQKNCFVPETIHFGFDSFGWEAMVYDDIQTKANYFWTAVCSEFQNLNQENELNQIKLKLINILTDFGVKNITFEYAEYSTSTWNNDASSYLVFDGYIDHYSDLCGWAQDMINEPGLLLGYLFNNESIVSTGNDNSDTDLTYAKNEIYSRYKGN